MITVNVFDLTKAPFEHGQEIPKETYTFEIRHSRNYDGNKITQNGGHTFLFCRENGRVYGSKCNRLDKFHKRLGVMVCIQRMIGKAMIIDFVFKKDHVDVYIDRSGSVDMWFLKANFRSYSEE